MSGFAARLTEIIAHEAGVDSGPLRALVGENCRSRIGVKSTTDFRLGRSLPMI